MGCDIDPFRSRNGASRLAMEEVVESACRISPVSIGSRETLSNEAYYHEVFTMRLLPWSFFTIKSQGFLGVSSKKNPIAPQFLGLFDGPRLVADLPAEMDDQA